MQPTQSSSSLTDTYSLSLSLFNLLSCSVQQLRGAGLYHLSLFCSRKTEGGGVYFQYNARWPLPLLIQVSLYVACNLSFSGQPGPPLPLNGPAWDPPLFPELSLCLARHYDYSRACGRPSAFCAEETLSHRVTSHSLIHTTHSHTQAYAMIDGSQRKTRLQDKELKRSTIITINHSS